MKKPASETLSMCPSIQHPWNDKLIGTKNREQVQGQGGRQVCSPGSLVPAACLEARPWETEQCRGLGPGWSETPLIVLLCDHGI